MFKRGLIAWSADPIHNGHIDLAIEAKKNCEKLLVNVSNNDDKKGSYLFSLSDRVEFVRRALKGIDGVEVIQSPTEILVDTYLHFGCDALFRGIRDEKDQAYEETQMGYHKMIYPKLNPVYLDFRGKSNVSSTMVKAFTSHHVDVSRYVPIFVKRALEESINKQYKIAVTGGIAVGKSWVANNLAFNLERLLDIEVFDRFRANVIKFDDLIRAVYDDPAPGPVELRREIDRLVGRYSKIDGMTVFDQDGSFNRDVLAGVMFSKHTDPKFRLEVQSLTAPFVDAKYREALKKAGPGIVVIEWAQLAEMEVGHWTNHNVIVVDSSDRQTFVEKRKISPETFSNRTRYQWSAEEKVKALEKMALKAGEGHIIQFNNTLQDNKIMELAEAVLRLLQPRR